MKFPTYILNDFDQVKLLHNYNPVFIILEQQKARVGKKNRWKIIFAFYFIILHLQPKESKTEFKSHDDRYLQ